MCVDRGVPGGSGKVFAVFVRDVLALAVFITLCQSEVNDVNLIFRLVRSADQEVVRLDVTVDYPLLVHLLDAHQLDIYSEQVDGVSEFKFGLTICLAMRSTVFKSKDRLQD